MTKIKVYQSPYGSQVGKVFIEKNKNETNETNETNKTGTDSDVETIIILDTSGSMSSYLSHIITKYLPDVLCSAGYSKKKITLITFSSSSRIYSLTPEEIQKSGISAGGGTNMCPALVNLKGIISLSKYKKFRIITMSDGELGDQGATVQFSTTFSKEIEGLYNIRSSAIRLFTSSQHPDTRGLASIMQLNNVGSSNLLDCHFELGYNSMNNQNNNKFCDILSTVINDNLSDNVKLISSNSIFMRNPWDVPQKEIYLNNGSNTFWLTNLLETVDGEERQTNVEIVYGDKLTKKIEFEENGNLDINNFNEILSEKISDYTKRLKLLKVIDMNDSKEEITKIVEYFTQLEKILNLMDTNDVDLTKDTSLKSRLNFFKKQAFRQSKSISQSLANIANQDKVSQLNSAQQAEYLRNATTSSNTISLAKRGLKEGFDFDEKAIKEVKNMKMHFHELKDIDDSNHAVSFYGQDTTLGGIRTLCELDDESLNNIGALEILQLLNIVGIPADAIVGDFPDPKTYHINELMLGAFISMSDIITMKQMKHTLVHPFTKKPIVNTIPFYDDDRIQQFLVKHAPNLLEYTASLGMRNMMINIPHTYKYTIVDGLWWMSRVLQDQKTQANVDIFIKLVHTYKTAVCDLFDYVPELIKPMSEQDKLSNLSLFIANNGITNMIGPLINIQNNPEKIKMIPDVLRALYTFEFYQVIRKYFRTDSDGHIKRKEMLDQLLGIDFNKYGSKLPPLFESQKVPIHHGEYHLNEDIFSSIIKKVFWVDYVCQMPKMFNYALNNDANSLLSILKTDEECQNSLSINFSLEKFKLFCIVQGFLYDTLSSRYDENLRKMKIEDPGNESRLDDFIKDYIQRQYHSHYQSELSKQNKKENELLLNELVEKLVESESVNDFNKLLSNGITRNHVSVTITDMFKDGFINLRDKMFNPNSSCPDRANKLRVLILGTDEKNNIIYNKGNTIKMALPDLERLCNLVGCGVMWKNIKDTYIEKSIHLYRMSNTPNRHSHSNDKPSYWAFGFETLGAYFATLNKQQQNEYCSIHTHCCGIWDGKVYRLK